MPTVVVVHGTGVRETGYQEMISLVKRRLGAERPSYEVAECPWYKDFGVAPPPYDSLPLKPGFRSAGAVAISDELLAWQGLYIDPLAEMRVFADMAPGGGNPTAAALISEKIRQVKAPESLAEFGMDATWIEARDVVLRDEVTRVAISRGPSRPDAIRLTVARALVAELVRRNMELGKVVPDGEVRDGWVGALRQSMGSDIAVGARAVPLPLQPVARLVNRYLIRPFAESHSPIAGDIVFYQGRGKKMRDFIAGTISAACPPVYVMAHSLGGIAAVDTLIEDATLRVDALITFGSQAPFFFEINALASLEKGMRLPTHFPGKWLNVCDANDLLSFRAKVVFNNDPRIIDEQLDSGQPPLAAHSSYLGSNSFWRLVWSILPS